MPAHVNAALLPAPRGLRVCAAAREPGLPSDPPLSLPALAWMPLLRFDWASARANRTVAE